MKQEQVQKQKARSEETYVDESNVDATNVELAEKTDAVLDSIDDLLADQDDLDLLDDIDDLLEENAAEFVAAFVQLGGE